MACVTLEVGRHVILERLIIGLDVYPLNEAVLQEVIDCCSVFGLDLKAEPKEVPQLF